MKVSYGDLPLPNHITVKKTGANTLQFKWDGSDVAGGSRQDQAMLLAYDVNNKAVFYNLTGQFRSTGKDTLVVDGSAGHTYQLYLAFTAADRSRQSASVYLGEWKMV